MATKHEILATLLSCIGETQDDTDIKKIIMASKNYCGADCVISLWEWHRYYKIKDAETFNEHISKIMGKDFKMSKTNKETCDIYFLYHLAKENDADLLENSGLALNDFSTDKSLDYNTTKDAFNKQIVKVGSVYINMETNVIYKTQQLKDAFNHIGYTNEKGKRKKFINDWLDNITDDMTVYDKFCCYPKNCMVKEGEYNLWQPFTYQDLTNYDDKDIEGLNFIFNHLNILCNHEKPVFDFMLLWLAQLVQYPEHKSLCPIFKSGQGTGKNMFIEFIGNVLGKGKLLTSSQPDKYVWGDFNGQMKDCYLVHLAEINHKMFVDKGAVFNLITDTEININQKGKDSFTINSYHRFIATTNNDIPIYIDKGNRRFILIQCSDEKKGDTEYFNTLAQYMQSPIVQRSFYDFLMNHKTKPVLTERDIPITEYQQIITEASKDTLDIFIEDVVMNNYDKAEVKLSSNEFFDLYRMFCTQSNSETRMTQQQFSTRIGLKKIKGIHNLGAIWYKGKMNRVYQLNITEMKPDYNIKDI